MNKNMISIPFCCESNSLYKNDQDVVNEYVRCSLK